MLQALKPGRMRYTMFTNDRAGILDDLMVTRFDDHLFVVVNAACKEADTVHLKQHLGDAVEPLADRLPFIHTCCRRSRFKEHP